MDIEQNSQCDVLIIGAGPVGLFLACELGSRGVSTIVVEERAGLVPHPKANTHNARSMEIYRQHGIALDLRDTGLPMDRATDVAYFSRLFGHELHRVSLPSPRAAMEELREPGTRWPSAEPQLRASQMVLEPLLFNRASSFASVDIRFGWRASAMVAKEDGVSVTITRGDEENVRIEAGYVVGCDGGRSWTRRELAIPFIGDEGLKMEFLGGRMQATYFRAPKLLERFPHADTWMHWIMHPQGRSILVLIDPARHEFLLHYQLPSDQPTPDFGARLAAMAGEPMEFEIISGAEWRAGIGVVAEQYGRGRVLLAGDAAHLFTPTGGFGVNTGIEDAFNLGWKLALASRGAAGPALLDSYTAERRPVAIRNTRYALELASGNGACPVSPELDADGPEGEATRAETSRYLARFARWEFDTPGIQLGGRYDGSPVIVTEAGEPPVDSATQYVPSALPGGRLPHMWMADGASLFDRLGQEFTLLVLGERGTFPAWTDAAKQAGVDLRIVAIPDLPETRALYEADILLVRPDNYVAWRGAADETALPLLMHAIGFA
ncbi:2-polyprenyl-6-methoxyphenol hydroxylase [Sphingobium faniae]|nr:2-polyprenyl-6-methoxyphenol hydroxylase [Sphingobium faniae]